MLEITCLVENISNFKDLDKEHGLSLYIERDGNKYLVDTGATGKFMDNAKKLNIDLKDLDAVIITHNHSDHIGGLEELLKYNDKVKVYIKSQAKSEFYYKFGIVKKYIGEKRDLFNEYFHRFVFFNKEMEINSGVKLYSNEVMDNYFFCKDTALLEKKDGKYIMDKFEHELFVVFEEKEGLVIVSSCSHNGIVNILNTVKEKYANKKILKIVGGFHMMGFGLNPLNCSKDYVKEVSNILEESCSSIHTCHCTGVKAYELMKENLGHKISYLETGGKIIV